jgi:hypothetical protein
VLADVAERDVGMVAPGQTATVRPRGYPGQTFTGKITLVYPMVNKETRTVRVRIELANTNHMLLPDMYADVEIAAGSEQPVLAVPDDAVIDSGARKLVLLDKGEGRFEPREVTLGRRGRGYIEIRSGAAAGDKVVVSANFLIDAESNLKAALQSLMPAGNTQWSRNETSGRFAIATVFAAIVIDQRHDPLTVQTGGKEWSNAWHDEPDMMWGMGAFGLLGVIVLVLVIAALIKYVFFR